jgi:polar amino acid transport system substrate-binding protein
MKTRLILPSVTIFLTVLASLLLPLKAASSEPGIGMIAMEQILYGFENEAGEKTGVLYDLLVEIRENSGIGLPVVIQPAKRLLATMSRGKKSCTIVINSPDVVNSFDVIEPIGYTLAAGILPVAGIQLKEYSDLKKIKIAVPLGIVFDDRFHSDTTLNKISTPKYINGIKMMKLGRIDAVAGAVSVLKFIAKQEGLNSHFFDDPLIFTESDLYLVCSFKLSNNERKKLQQAAIQLRSSGKAQDIFNRYFSAAN